MKLITLGRKRTSSNNSCYSGAVLNPTALKTRNRFKIGSFLVLMVFGLAMLLPSQMQAQDPPVLEDYFDLPNPDRCTSKDLRILTADLVVDNCNCVEGTLDYVNLTLGIQNTTSSQRTSFAFWSRLTTTDPDTMQEVVYFITGCTGPILPSQSLQYEFGENAAGTLQILDVNGNIVNYPNTTDPLLQIPYVCGTTLELTNIYEAWTDASTNDSRQCPLDPSKINPKCDVLPAITVGIGLTANDGNTNVSCYGGSDGTVTLTFSGGTAPYFVNFNGGGFTEESSPKTYTGLAAGLYSWFVKDSSDPYCEKSGFATVGQPTAALSSTFTQQNVLCYGGATGSINLSPTGGTAPYVFAWTKVGDATFSASTEDLSNLTAGTYNVVITDANGTTGGCRATNSVTITQPTAALSSTFTQQNVLCYGGATGSIDLSPTGGTAPYVFAWTKVGDATFSASTEDLSNLTAGTYNVVITDANGTTGGCRATNSVTITQPTAALSGSAVPTAESCAFNDGSIILTVSGGTSPYSYLWSNNATTKDLSGLAAGLYSVTITDANGCVALASATVNGPGTCVTDEGCTLGYWKEHTDRWCVTYTTCTTYGSVFTLPNGSGSGKLAKFGDLTLLEGLNLGGNKDGENLVRQSIAALLNACSGEVGFALSVNALKTAVNAAWANGTYNAYAITLDGLNQASPVGCPLEGTSATTEPTPGCVVTTGKPNKQVSDTNMKESGNITLESSSTEEQFSAYPVPFKETLNIQYKFNYVSDVTIQIFDMRGQLMLNAQEANASKDKVTTLSVDFARGNQVYIVQVKTDRETFLKKVISKQ